MERKKFIVNADNARDYIAKIGCFIEDKVKSANARGVVLGMSGGIDCSVVACLCKRAGVAVSLFMLPDGVKDDDSARRARIIIDKFGFDGKTVDIRPVCETLEGVVRLSGESKLNLRPRVRMTVLYSIAQTEQRLVIGTSNLSERMIGYFTKWGDGASDLNPLGMLTKGEVRILASALSIPDEIVYAPPTAGLYEGQTDEKDLGLTYEQIDRYILFKTSGDKAADIKIKKRMNLAIHKLNPISVFND